MLVGLIDEVDDHRPLKHNEIIGRDIQHGS